MLKSFTSVSFGPVCLGNKVEKSFMYLKVGDLIPQFSVLPTKGVTLLCEVCKIFNKNVSNLGKASIGDNSFIGFMQVYEHSFFLPGKKKLNSFKTTYALNMEFFLL